MPEELETAPAEQKAARKPIVFCDRCGLPHPPLIDCVDAMKDNVKLIVMRAGDVDRCRGCGATIFWIRHINGANTPYTAAGLIHFIDCPKREEFKKK